jgi:hypothetical protein
MCDGDSNEDIARRFQLSIATVKWNVYHVFGKLGVQRRTQAVAIAIHLRLVQPAWLNAAVGAVIPLPEREACWKSALEQADS